MEDELEVQCPYCFDRVEIRLGPGALGEQQEPCGLCGRRFRLTFHRDEWGDPVVQVERRG